MEIFHWKLTHSQSQVLHINDMYFFQSTQNCNYGEIEMGTHLNSTYLFFPYNYRVTPESDIDDDHDGSVLSLGLFPGEYLDSSTALSGSGMADDRVFFRFEAAWDSSLHNSLLLNRVTPAGETIYMTISAYLEVSTYYYKNQCHQLCVMG